MKKSRKSIGSRKGDEILLYIPLFKRVFRTWIRNE